MIFPKSSFKSFRSSQAKKTDFSDCKEQEVIVNPIEYFSETADSMIRSSNKEFEKSKRRYSVDRMKSTREKNEFKKHADVLYRRNNLLLENLTNITTQPSNLIRLTYKQLALMSRSKTSICDTRPADLLSWVNECEKSVIRQLKTSRRLTRHQLKLTPKSVVHDLAYLKIFRISNKLLNSVYLESCTQFEEAKKQLRNLDQVYAFFQVRNKLGKRMVKKLVKEVSLSPDCIIASVTFLKSKGYEKDAEILKNALQNWPTIEIGPCPYKAYNALAGLSEPCRIQSSIREMINKVNLSFEHKSLPNEH